MRVSFSSGHSSACAVLFSMAFVGSLAAQSTTVVPASAEFGDGTSVRRVAGFVEPFRQQLLIDPVHLSTMLGERLSNLQLRRDAGTVQRAFNAGEVQLKVWLSTSPNTASSPSDVFATNRGVDRALVFDDVLVLPAARAVGPGRPSGFDVEIGFSTPFTYQGGTLLIEFEGSPVVGSEASEWPVDAVVEDVQGAATTVGFSCGALSRGGGTDTAHVAAGELIPGSTVNLLLRAEAGRPAILMVSGFARPGLMDLSLVGFEVGCSLHLAGVAASVATLTASDAVSATLGAPAVIPFQIPSHTSVLGASLAVQWIEVSSTGLRASNGLELTVASRLPSLGMALVESSSGSVPLPSSGRVTTGAGLVVRFTHMP